MEWNMPSPFAIEKSTPAQGPTCIDTYSEAQQWGKVVPTAQPWGMSTFWYHNGLSNHFRRGSGTRICQDGPGRSPIECTCTRKLPYEYPDHHPQCAWTDPSQLLESVLSVLRQKTIATLYYTMKTLNLYKSCRSGVKEREWENMKIQFTTKISGTFLIL
jgi:hypothetical protein